MIFESHTHFDDEAFDEDRDTLIIQAKQEGIEKIINVAASLSSVKTTMELALKYDYIYAAIGIHPSDTGELNEDNFLWMKEIAKNQKVVAIGEIGLDYHYDEPDKEWQIEWFKRQLDLALELDKPVSIHSREAAADTLSILKEEKYQNIRGVIHCYSYSPEMARELCKLGYYFGIGGVVTFSNAKKLVETVKELPLEKILLETDSPYLAPVPLRGKRNSSLNLPLIAKKIAEIKDIDYDTVVNTTYENACKLFDIK